MSEHTEPEDDISPEQEQEEIELLAVLQKMQQQLEYLEKKIDTLLAQSSGGAPRGGDRFSRPPRPYGGGGGGYRGDRDRGPRDFGSRDRAPRDYGPPRGGRDFGPRRDSGPGRSFDRPQGDAPRQGGGFGGRAKKPFRRDR